MDVLNLKYPSSIFKIQKKIIYSKISLENHLYPKFRHT